MVDTSARSSRAPLLSSPSSSWRNRSRSSSSGAGAGEEGRVGEAFDARRRTDDTYGSVSSKDDDDDDDVPSTREEDSSTIASQDGVQQADAINLVWTKTALVTAYLFIFLSAFARDLQYQVMSNLMPFVVSEFASHSLIPTIGIVASILSGVLKLPVAKLIDTWGRPQGLTAMTALATFGLVLMAASQSVQTYAASQVIYQVGISGFSYVLDIIVADTSSLQNRVLAMAFSSMPNLLTSFLGPVIAGAFYAKDAWRGAFVLFAALFAVLCVPVIAILVINASRAKKLGLLHKGTAATAAGGGAAGNWTWRNVRRHLVDHDALGMLLITAGLTLILVPFSLAGSQETKHGLNSYAAAIAAGAACMAAFVLHERRAPRPFMKFSLLTSRNVAGAWLLCITIFVAYFSWDGYYTSYLQVVHDLSITQAGYIGHIYGFGSCVWALVVGYLIRRSDRFKWLAVAALPVHILGGALMIAFRRPDTHLAWVIACQVLITVGGSTLVVCDQMAVWSVVDHGELASAMALLSLAMYVGSATGSALSGAIWNSTLPAALADLLPRLPPAERAAIAADLKRQLSYPVGSPVRDAIVAAYARAQLRMCIVGTAVSLLEVVAVAVWRDKRLSRSRQVKGTVI
ncbi:major facilitator superfamily domain-containing protein [Biscogniauxia mediterranea]|nr:major facilitator superfamily domain-containing protein [Biscogniauxia mediterranea]